jgi:hypothetical protein
MSDVRHDPSDPKEWLLLHEVAVASRSTAAMMPQRAGDEELGVLAALANYYQDRAAWDEFSTVRSRQLEHVPPGPGPVPGGPFPHRRADPSSRRVDGPVAMAQPRRAPHPRRLVHALIQTA